MPPHPLRSAHPKSSSLFLASCVSSSSATLACSIQRLQQPHSLHLCTPLASANHQQPHSLSAPLPTLKCFGNLFLALRLPTKPASASMTHVLVPKGGRQPSAMTWMTRTLRHVRHSLHRSRCSTAVVSTLLTLYSVLLCLVSLPLLTTPLAATPAPTSTAIHPASPDEPYPLPLHQPIPRLSHCYGVYELKGRRHYMEDTHAVLGYGQLTMSRMAASSDFAKEVEESGWKDKGGLVHEERKSVDVSEASEVDGSGWLLFGVFDGHGGPDASTYTATHLLPLLHSRLSAYEQQQQSAALPPPPVNNSITLTDCNDSSDSVTADAASSAASLCAAVSIHTIDTLSSSPSLLPPQHNLTAAFSASYHIVDEGYKLHPLAHHRRHEHSDGSTALVAAVNVVKGQVVVANAGDCRAIAIAEDMGEGKELVERDRWRNAMGWMCSRRDGKYDEEDCIRASDSDEDDDEETVATAVDAEDDEEDVLDEKTAAITEAELMDMYHHFHPALPPSPSSPAPPPPAGLFLPLSFDHKPHLPLERLYIQSQPAGFITQSRYYGISRVQGVLATSRAIGDYELRPHVRCEPDVVGWQMSAAMGKAGQQQGRWLLLGSDGLFDVWSNAAVAQWVRQQAGRGLSVQRMAKELVMAAYRMGSEDNISALIVDLHCLRATQAQVASEQQSRDSVR